jgi:hypothetical protein
MRKRGIAAVLTHFTHDITSDILTHSATAVDVETVPAAMTKLVNQCKAEFGFDPLELAAELVKEVQPDCSDVNVSRRIVLNAEPALSALIAQRLQEQAAQNDGHDIRVQTAVDALQTVRIQRVRAAHVDAVQQSLKHTSSTRQPA